MRLDLPRAVLLIGLVALLALPGAAWYLDEPFYLTFASRVLIFAIAALSLDLILGFGGMVSFGHAAFLGIGAYAVGIFAYYEIFNGPLQWLVAILLSAAIAALIGLISLRTTGVYFIMITLAFAQMLFFLATSVEEYGGDDGMTIWRTSDFGGVIDLGNKYSLYYVILAIMLACLYFSHRLVNSRFGMVIRGAKSNPLRMEALGFPVFRYRLLAFVFAGMMCGVSGVLLANFIEFVNPNFMHWTRSGELIFMVVMGGMGTLFGPVIGAAAFLVLEEVLKGITEYWQIILGPLLVLLVLFAKGGIYGALISTRRGGG